MPLWKRLAYVAITRAEKRLHWVVRNRLALPKRIDRGDGLNAQLGRNVRAFIDIDLDHTNAAFGRRHGCL